MPGGKEFHNLIDNGKRVLARITTTRGCKYWKCRDWPDIKKSNVPFSKIHLALVCKVL